MDCPRIPDHELPLRLVLAGGWFDQPYVNLFFNASSGAITRRCAVITARLYPTPELAIPRCGLATSTRQTLMRSPAMRREFERLEATPPDGYGHIKLATELFQKEASGTLEQGSVSLSGSQDAFGLVLPGVRMLHYATGASLVSHKVTSGTWLGIGNNAEFLKWLGRIIQLKPIGPRPHGYNPFAHGIFPSEATVNLLGEGVYRMAEALTCLAQPIYNRSNDDTIKQAILRRVIPYMRESFALTRTAWRELMPGIFDPRPPVGRNSRAEITPLWQEVEKYNGILSGCGGGFVICASFRLRKGFFRPHFWGCDTTRPVYQ